MSPIDNFGVTNLCGVEDDDLEDPDPDNVAHPLETDDDDETVTFISLACPPLFDPNTDNESDGSSLASLENLSVEEEEQVQETQVSIPLERLDNSINITGEQDFTGAALEHEVGEATEDNLEPDIEPLPKRCKGLDGEVTPLY